MDELVNCCALFFFALEKMMSFLGFIMFMYVIVMFCIFIYDIFVILLLQFHIAPNSAIKVSKLFDDLVTNIKCYSIKRVSSDINYKLLARGDLEETRFVLGKVIMDTMYCQNLPTREQDSSMENKSGGRLSRLFM